MSDNRACFSKLNKAIVASKRAAARLRRIKEAARFAPATAAPAHFPYRDHRPVSQCLPRHSPYLPKDFGYGE